jgi:hypothetical protein
MSRIVYYELKFINSVTLAFGMFGVGSGYTVSGRIGSFQLRLPVSVTSGAVVGDSCQLQYSPGA